jgi:hypothetical protein
VITSFGEMLRRYGFLLGPSSLIGKVFYIMGTVFFTRFFVYFDRLADLFFVDSFFQAFTSYSYHLGVDKAVSV